MGGGGGETTFPLSAGATSLQPQVRSAQLRRCARQRGRGAGPGRRRGLTGFSREARPLLCLTGICGRGPGAELFYREKTYYTDSLEKMRSRFQVVSVRKNLDLEFRRSDSAIHLRGPLSLTVLPEL